MTNHPVKEAGAVLPQKGVVSIDSRTPEHPPILFRFDVYKPVPWDADEMTVEIVTPFWTYRGQVKKGSR